MSGSGWQNFISNFMEYTEGTFSPELHKKWTAIAMVAGALERRVYIPVSGNRRTFPNLYTFLVGVPGVGKQIIDDAKGLFEEVQRTGQPAFRVAPHSMTKASMIDCLLRSKQGFLPPVGSPVEYSSMFVFAEEVGIMMPAYDTDFLGVLNGLYSNPATHTESRRTGSVREAEVLKPQINILAGVQPGYLSSVFPDEAWTTGFVSRTIMVYGTKTREYNPRQKAVDVDYLRPMLVRQLERFAMMNGEVDLTEEADEVYADWITGGLKPVSEHSRLQSYNARRNQHLLKLALVCAISRTGQYTIEGIDVRTALAWLIEAESQMPSIFLEMRGRSDGQVLEELYGVVLQHWIKQNRKNFGEDFILSFLANRVPSEKVTRMLELAERTGCVIRDAGSTSYRPGAKFNRNDVI